MFKAVMQRSELLLQGINQHLLLTNHSQELSSAVGYVVIKAMIKWFCGLTMIK